MVNFLLCVRSRVDSTRSIFQSLLFPWALIHARPRIFDWIESSFLKESIKNMFTILTLILFIVHPLCNLAWNEITLRF